MAVILSAGASRKVPCVAGTVLGRRGRVKGRACSMLDMIPRPAMLARLAARQLRSHPWQLGLAILGIALGVAVAVSIDLANGSALRAFALATEAVSGRATHQILGGPSGLPDDLYRRLRVDVGVRRAAPIVEGDVAVADRVVDVAAADRAGDTPRAGRVGRSLHLLGIDPFVDSHFRPYLAAEDRGEARGRDALSRAADLVGRAGTALIAASTARDLSLAIGRELAIEVSGHRRTLTIVGLLQPVDPASARALDGLLVTDIATAQETLGAVGRLTRIDLIVGDDAPGRALLARVAQALPAGADLVSAGATAGATARMIMAFQWNLAALSLLALVVGMFLIYQTMTFSVVQRRPLIGSLRALGVTRGEIFALVMSEALVIGIAGTLLGLGLGFGMAQGLLRLVTRTINDLYFVLSVREVALDPVTLAKSVLLGIGATALAALPPALEATAAPPRIVMSRASLESSARRRAPGRDAGRRARQHLARRRGAEPARPGAGGRTRRGSFTAAALALSRRRRHRRLGRRRRHRLRALRQSPRPACRRRRAPAHRSGRAGLPRGRRLLRLRLQRRRRGHEPPHLRRRVERSQDLGPGAGGGARRRRERAGGRGARARGRRPAARRPLKPRAARGVDGDLRPHVRHHRRAAHAEPGGGVRRHAGRAHGALARARARDRRAARARPDAAPGLGPRHRPDRRHRAPGRRPRRAERPAAGRRPRLRHQPPLVRLDDVNRPVAVDSAAGRRAVAAGRAPRRPLSRLAHGHRTAGRVAAR